MAMKTGTVMPKLEGAIEWFNATQAHAEAEAKGHPTLVHFWSVSCEVCRTNMARVAAWREEYAARGLRVVAVHSPRTADDADVEVVREALYPLDITYPCAVDHDGKLSEAFQIGGEELPAYYLFDREGKLVSSAIGGPGVDATALALKSLLADSGAE